jgi:inorganic triphosphatase YgiF
MEIEKKYRIDDTAHFATFAALASLGHYTLRHEAHSKHQQNVYYDTADRRLGNARYGLRIRQTDGHSVATLKGPGDDSAGTFRREEWEFATDNPDPATWPAGEARERALSIINQMPLLPLLTIETQRRHTIALRDEVEIAEFSLDQSTIYANQQSEHFCELEIELLPAGSEADLSALEHSLGQHIPLVPEDRTKLERGIALLDSTPSP